MPAGAGGTPTLPGAVCIRALSDCARPHGTGVSTVGNGGSGMTWEAPGVT
jgi:hypothetical protein